MRNNVQSIQRFSSNIKNSHEAEQQQQQIEQNINQQAT